MRNSGLDDLQAGIKIGRRNNNIKYADDTTLMTEIKEELKSLLMRVNEEHERSGLELMPSNCAAGEGFESPLDSKGIRQLNPKGNQH